jgi:hypothetical protein
MTLQQPGQRLGQRFCMHQNILWDHPTWLKLALFKA